MSSGAAVYIVEDDFITQSQIKTYLKKVGYLVAGSSGNANQALLDMKSSVPDVIILDINLAGDEDGIWLAGQLQDQVDIPFIFLTANKEQSIIQKALQLKPYGYLIKPFEAMDLYSAIEVALLNYVNAKQGSIDQKDNRNIILKDSLFVKENSLLIKIKFDEIIYLMSEGNYIEIYAANKKSVLRGKLDQLLDKLPSSQFVRVHQRYIVNLLKVSSIAAGSVYIDDINIPISKTYREDLMTKIQTL